MMFFSIYKKKERVKIVAKFEIKISNRETLKILENNIKSNF